MVTLKRISNIVKYGVGQEARERKRAEKAELRRAMFESDRWQRDTDLAKRRYASYEEYLAHQVAKFDKVAERKQSNQKGYLADFVNRFQSCAALSEARTVLCLGARLGTEVQALHSLGYFAVGIDLQPGPDNPYVLPGDFHGIVFPDGSVDAIYTNALDHVFDLEKVIVEVRRLLRHNGLFVADVIAGFDQGSAPGEYESIHWNDAKEFIDKVCGMGSFTLEEVRDIEQTFDLRDRWTQAVFRMPA